MCRSVYRIIDADFNRAREAIRLIEEFCRFAVDSEPLTERAKQLRHQLCAAVGKLDAGRLISSRDTLGDVGIGRTVDGQLVRSDLDDCLTASCKRLTEALRVLAEMAQTLNPSVAGAIEDLRYTAYTLEKDIIVFSDTAGRFRAVRLYVVITGNLPAEVLFLAERCASAGADCIQLRAKDIEDDRLFALAVELVRICKEAKVISIINDRVDIAVAADADGVHLGQNDLPIESARRLQHRPLIIGRSTHSLEQLNTACRQHPSYVSLGPVFATGTKPAEPAVGTDYLKQAIEILADTPMAGVAIGGVTLDNLEQVLKTGVSAVAVCSAISTSGDPAAYCRALKEKMAAFGG